jgi:hypothetical protein
MQRKFVRRAFGPLDQQTMHQHRPKYSSSTRARLEIWTSVRLAPSTMMSRSRLNVTRPEGVALVQISPLENTDSGELW